MNENEARDKILLAGIQFYGRHGVSDEEQAVGHRYAVDLELTADLRRAGQTDALADTINYAAICRLVMEVGTLEQFRLLEALAERIASRILAEYPVRQVRVRVKKLLPPVNGIVEYAAVEIARPT